MPSLEQATGMPKVASTGLGVTKGLPKLQTTLKQKLNIIDIRRVAVEANLKSELLSLFCTKDGPRKLPTLLLYDERGLQLFEKASPSPSLAAAHQAPH